jgi:hypothetical protein
MSMLLGVASILGLSLFTIATSVQTGLWVSLALSVAVVVRTPASRRSPKILETGACALLGGLTLYDMAVAGGSLSLPQARAVLDGGLLAIIVGSIAVRQPFTLQYARAQVPFEIQNSPIFVRVNNHIARVWAAAFAASFTIDLAMQFYPAIPGWAGMMVLALAFLGAVCFSRWYPKHVRSRLLRAPGIA